MNKQEMVENLAAAMTSERCSDEARKLWVDVAETLAECAPDSEYLDDAASDVANGIVDGWCIYFGDAEELAKGLGLGQDDADAGLAVVLEQFASTAYQPDSLAGLTHAAWTEAVRSHVCQSVVELFDLLCEEDWTGWDIFGLDDEAALVAARLWADGSALSIWELVETAGNLTAEVAL